MSTTFDVLFLGSTGTFRMDPTEGNTTVENAASLNGLTAGSAANPLYAQQFELSPGSTGFGAGVANVYDTDNNAVGGGETFILNGTTELTFDAAAVFNATLTYTDGTTATITAVVFQDTGGNLFLAPEFTANSDQAALEAKPIESLTFGSPTANPAIFNGLTADRLPVNFAVCFTPGTRLLTPRGYVAIDALHPGDLLTTVDNGAQRIEWIGSTRVSVDGLKNAPNMRPIRLRQGHRGLRRDILVSPQHCVAVGDSFVRARHLAEIPGAGARVARGVSRVEYIHVLCERHEMLIAEGMQTESFYPGPQTLRALGPQALADLHRIAPDLSGGIGPTARRVLRRRDLRDVAHHQDLVAFA